MAPSPHRPSAPTAHRRGRRSAALVAALATALVAMASACGAQGDPAPSTTVAPAPMVSIQRSGGLCATGPCSDLLVVQRDGAFERTVNGTRSTGTLDPVQAQRIRDAIDTQLATLSQLQRAEPVGCPSRADGTDITITFQGPDGPVVVSNCAVVLDEANPLVAAALAAAS